jgi:NitT/TauT family transport system permease protein
MYENERQTHRTAMRPPAKATVSRLTWLDVTAPLLVLMCAVAGWQLIVMFSGLPSLVLPAPAAVGAAAWEMRGALLESAWRTTLAAATGLAASVVIGCLIAFAFSQSALIRRAFYPYAVLLQTVPVVAVAPIVIVSLGRGFSSIALVAHILSLFPIITSTTTGLLQVDPGLRELFRLNSATRWQTLVKLRLPSSLPYLISGIRIAGGAAIVGAIVGEFFVGDGSPGLGQLIQRKSVAYRLPELYAAVLTSALLGTTVFGTTTVVGDRILRRWFGMSLSGTR